MFSVPAKISRPVLSNILPRTRLFSGLDKAAKRLIVWIAAPPGSGKTTLIASYLEFHKLPHIWYHLDEGDRDIATFFHYLALAANNAGLRRGPPLPHFTPEFILGVAAFSRRFFEILYGGFTAPTAIVFDNFDEVPAEPAFQEVFRAALNAVPRDVTVFVLSRHAPPESMARLRGANRMALLGWPDLRLTLDETEAIITHINRPGPSVGGHRRIHERAQGWAAGSHGFDATHSTLIIASWVVSLAWMVWLVAVTRWTPRHQTVAALAD